MHSHDHTDVSEGLKLSIKVDEQKFNYSTFTLALSHLWFRVGRGLAEVKSFRQSCRLVIPAILVAKHSKW